MKPERVVEIYEAVGAISASIGDLPETGAGPLIQIRLRSLTDGFDLVKVMASEVRQSLNEVSKSLRASTTARSLRYRSALTSEVVQALTGQEIKKARAQQVVDEELGVGHTALEDELSDLQALSDVIEYRSSAVKTTISNLRKEWEMIYAHRSFGDGGESKKFWAASSPRGGTVEESIKDGILEIDGRGGNSANASGVQKPESDRGSVHVEDVLNGLDR